MIFLAVTDTVGLVFFNLNIIPAGVKEDSIYFKIVSLLMVIQIKNESSLNAEECSLKI